MTAVELMGDSPYLTLFAICIVCELVFKMWNRLMRHLNIRKHGWPPDHCDADGDFKPLPEGEEP